MIYTDCDFGLAESSILTSQDNITHHSQFTASTKLKEKTLFQYIKA